TLNLSFILDGTSHYSNIYVENESYVNLTAWTNAEGAINFTFNGSQINYGNTLIYNNTPMDTIGTFNITAFYNETQNYSSNVLSYLIYVESQLLGPRITKLLPSSMYTNVGNATLKVNLTDATLKNATFYLYNSSGGLNSTNLVNISGMLNESNVSFTNLAEGRYNWSVGSCDESDNCNITSNYSLIVDTTNPVADNPDIDDTTITEDDSTEVVCAGTDALSEVKNISVMRDGSIVDSENDASINYTFSPSDDGTYDFKCRVFDNAGNYDDSSIVEVKVSSTSSSSSSSSSSSTTTTASTVYTFTYKSYSSLSAGQTIFINMLDRTISATGVQAISVAINGAASDVSFRVDKPTDSSITSKYSSSTETVLNYISIDHNNLDNSKIQNAIITFEVKKSVLNSNDYDKNSVKLKRHTTKWDELETKIVSEDSTKVVYNATSPGLSIFAITAVKPTTNVTGSAISNLTTTSEDDAENGVRSYRNLWISMGAMVAIILGFGIYFFIKKKGKFSPSKSHIESSHLHR
ncbi:MAG: PGF-pre-PGF domain-containing protein, partial [Nanoarchaeota archaeon]|nr:PGF-pre-PGF domain-containing protein [Nanoarchaeota archaeon]